MTAHDKLICALILTLSAGLASVAIGASFLSSRLGMIFGGAALSVAALYMLGLVWNSRP